MQQLQFHSIKEFYPYYLTQHREFKCRTLHFVGTGTVIGIFIFTLVTQQWLMLLLMPLVGYGFAWFGHFMFEKNKPAAFKNPLWSLACDFIMFWHILTGQIGNKIKEAEKAFPQFSN